MATDVINETSLRIDRFGISDLDSVRQAPEKLCAYSEEIGTFVSQLKSFLRQRLYKHPHLVAMSERAGDIITTIFNRILAEPSLMPPRFQQMLDGERIEIVAADYIAGMTDRYAEKVYGEVGG